MGCCGCPWGALEGPRDAMVGGAQGMQGVPGGCRRPQGCLGGVQGVPTVPGVPWGLQEALGCCGVLWDMAGLPRVFP